MHRKMHRLLLVALALVAACAAPDPEPAPEGERLAIALDQSDPERLVRYYFGSYAAPEGADPFAAGLVAEDGRDFSLDLAAFEQAAGAPAVAALKRAAAREGDAEELGWDELKAFVAETYYDARGWPATLGVLREEAAWSASDSAWFRVDATGSMTTARRAVYVPKSALRAALVGYAGAGERLMYPVGTVFVGEHLGTDGETAAEVTVMRKRADGFWDYATYGPDGRLAAATLEAPRSLATPTQCVGCHFGDRAFEPEKSFPRDARPGPHGPRGVHTDPALRRVVQETGIAERFREHTKRSDTILGLYNTLFVAQLIRDRAAGDLSPGDARLLEALGV